MNFGGSWKRLRLRLRYWARHSDRKQLLWEEMDFHIESMVQDLVGKGMSEQEARAAACRKFGNMTRSLEESRSIRIARWMSDLAQESASGVSRDAARCRIHRLCDSHRRPRHRSQCNGIQRGERAAASATAVPRSEASGVD